MRILELVRYSAALLVVTGILLLPPIRGDNCYNHSERELVGSSGEIKYVSESPKDECEWILPLDSYKNYVVVLSLTMAEIKLRLPSTTQCTALLKLPGEGDKCAFKTPYCILVASPVSYCDIGEIVSSNIGCSGSVLHAKKEKLQSISATARNAKDVDTKYLNRFTLEYHIIDCLPSGIASSNSTGNLPSSLAREKWLRISVIMLCALFLISLMVILLLLQRQRKLTKYGRFNGEEEDRAGNHGNAHAAIVGDATCSDYHAATLRTGVENVAYDHLHANEQHFAHALQPLDVAGDVTGDNGDHQSVEATSELSIAASDMH